MTEYTFSYRLGSAPQARTDGSGDIDHQIKAMSSKDGGAKVPQLHKTIVVPAADMKIVMDMNDTTQEQKIAKNVAYKDLLRTYRDRQVTPVAGWTDAQLLERVTANDLAAEQSTRANTYITDTLGQSYPIDFNL